MGRAWYWLVVGVAGSQWAWRQPAAARSGALRPRSDCARFASLDPRIEPLERRCSLQWCLWGEGPGTRTGSSHLALRRAGRRAGGGDVTFHPISLAEPLTVSLTISAGYACFGPNHPWTSPWTISHTSLTHPFDHLCRLCTISHTSLTIPLDPKERERSSQER